MKRLLALALPVLLAACASVPVEAARPAAGLGAAAFSPDGNLLVSGDTDGVLVAEDSETGRSVWRAAAHRGCVRVLAFSADGALVASAGEDGAVSVRRAADGSALWTVQIAPGALYEYDGVAFSPDGRVVAVGGLDSKVHLLAAADGSEIRSFETEGSTALLFTADGTRVLAGSWSSEVAVFDWATGIQQANWVAPDAFRGAGSGVSVLALSPDGRTLAEGDEDGRVRIWETADGKLLQEIEGPGVAVVGIGFAADGLDRVFADGTAEMALAWGPTARCRLGADPAELPVSVAALDRIHRRIAWGGWAGRIRFVEWKDLPRNPVRTAPGN